MLFSTHLPANLDEVDVVICGGGTAACVVAGRLAAADPTMSILLIEAGPNNLGNPAIMHPALIFSNLAPGSKTVEFYKSKPSEARAGKDFIQATGRVLGGGSSVNLMHYSRARGQDFDAWDMPGWSGNEMIRLMKKLETYSGHGPAAVHGYDGPLQVTPGPFRSTRCEEQLVQAATKLGIPIPEDLQDPTSGIGVEHALKFVTKEGKRHDAATAFVHPLLEDGMHVNLHVLCGCKVIRVLFDDTMRATGVEYSSVLGGDSNLQPFSVKAKKLVVVSCGALGSPLVLERSGIGCSSILKNASVPVLVDLPGVGEQYQDHANAVCAYTVDLDTNETLDAFLGGRMSFEEIAKNGLLTSNSVDVVIKYRPSEDEVAALGPDWKDAWKRDFQDQPTRPLMLFMTMNGAPPHRSEAAKEPSTNILMVPYVPYPYSRGHMHITGPKPEDPTDFDAGFLSDPQDLDLKLLAWAYKKAREWLRHTKMYKGDVVEEHPKWAPGSKVSSGAPTFSPMNAHDILPLQYGPEDDKAIEQHVRETVGSTYHSLGTCKMAPREKNGVVDADLNVYGVQGLKVVDLSIPPGHVAANTANTAFVIGEKGAEIIVKELRIREGSQ